MTKPLAETNPAERINIPRVFTARGCWSLTVARFFTGPAIYLVIFWLPEYLRNERQFNLEEVGRYAWVPFAFGGVGYLVGGGCRAT